MSGSITINPYATSQPQNSFLLQTQGYTQGALLDDPTARLELAGGVLNSAETIVMWGGRPILENINLLGSGSEGTGPSIKSATSQATCTGWSVTNQAGSMVISSGNSVPVSGVGNYVAFMRYNSNGRICVQCDPALYAALVAADGSIVSQALYWDVTNYRITLVTTGGNWALPVTTKLLSINTNSKIVSYASSVATWSTGDAAVIQI